MVHNCIKCGVPLIVDGNITQRGIDRYKYICRSCAAKRVIECNHRTGRCQPMNKNTRCASFLGVCVAERVMSHIFNHVERMPNGNHGYDFICGGGYKIDVKSSCRRGHEKHADQWMFHIRENQIAEYFLCLAFDNRDDLNPEHIWLIPSHKINALVGLSITESRLAKWKQYELPIDKTIACCNTMKSDPTGEST